MPGTQSPFDAGLERNAANYAPLSPVSFLFRAALVHPSLPSVLYEGRRFTWSQTLERARRLASALTRLGLGKNDTVAVMLPNVPAMVEAHFGVPMAGAVLNTLNTRLDAEAIAFMLRHGEAKAVLVDPETAPVMAKALAQLPGPRPFVIDVDDPAFADGGRIGDVEYEDFIAGGDPGFAPQPLRDEWDAITLNYTSGTTGNPKGVVYHHRGAYLNAVSNVLAAGIPPHPVYLWTLPMFHCNGWCFPWTIAALAGVNICLRKVDAAKIFDLIASEGVTHMCGAPIVYNMLINAPEAASGRSGPPVQGLIAGAAPPMAVIAGAEKIGVRITHVYGLTETYGPASVCSPQPGWEALAFEERVRLNRRQGVPYHLQEGVTVMNPATMQEVPSDGETMGEIMFRGNIVMKGYLKNPAATAEAFSGGWYHTGDIAVRDPDGYVMIKDRSKDVIISGGENISSVEVEDVLFRHPAVLLAAVVAKPDPKWGETPCAFIELKTGALATEAEIIAFCREHLAAFKTPKQVIFGEIPKTSTGKLQKFILRQRLNSTAAITA